MLAKIFFMILAACSAITASAVGAPDAAAAALDVEIVLTPQAGTTREDGEIRQWQKQAGEIGAKPEAFERLGWAYVAKARRTLDTGFYKLAEKTADAMDGRFGPSAESRLLRGHVLHNLHRFREAEAVARPLVAERGLFTDLALLSDVLMEQGKLSEVVEVLQRLVNLKPGVEAMSRVAHVRWLKGDLPGAIDAMESAMHAGSPRDAEPYAWTMSRLSGYYLQIGRLSAALNAAELATKHASAYAPALLARGRALLALGRVEDAVGSLRRATALNPLPEYQWWLADALRAGGQVADAAKVESELKARGEVSDPRTFALYLATRGESAALAVRLAREELADRRDVLSHDALAWALAASGDFAAAELEMSSALAEKTKDARLFFHAGEIALARGRTEAAQAFFNQAQAFAGTLTPSERERLASRSVGAAAPVARTP